MSGWVEVHTTTWWVRLDSGELATVRVDLPQAMPGNADVEVMIAVRDPYATDLYTTKTRVAVPCGITPKKALRAALKKPREAWQGELPDLGLEALKLAKRSLKRIKD